METNTAIVLFALVAALGLVSVMAVNVIEINAEKPPVKGCRTSVAANASQGRCVQG